MEKVIVIAGPTCSGKTSLAFTLAQRLNSEIISADSRQIYKFLDIGTAKPTKQELSLVKHHLVNELELDEVFNAGRFVEKSEEIISRLHSENKIPLIVGGTGLYIKSLIDGIINSVDTNEEIREQLLNDRKKFGNEYLYEALKKVDPLSASKMIPQNWKRIIRALEVYYISGKPIWQHFEEQFQTPKYTFLQFGLEWERSELYKRIEDRVEWMISNGLLDEVVSVLNMGYSKKLNALNTVGYKEIIAYLENEISLERAVDLIKRNTRRYAKRQITWFKADKRIEWLKINTNDDIYSSAIYIIEKVLNERKN